MDLHAWITQQVEQVERIALKAREDIPALLASGDIDNRFAERHIAANDPAAVLRRCAADRRILARHRIDPDQAAFPGACEGCGLDNWDLPNTESVNDCPELLDLAHAHGITDDILAGLHRPQLPERKPLSKRYANGGFLTPPITTRDVPAALRGPHWKP
jgi:hypothetical protein